MLLAPCSLSHFFALARTVQQESLKFTAKDGGIFLWFFTDHDITYPGWRVQYEVLDKGNGYRERKKGREMDRKKREGERGRDRS